MNDHFFFQLLLVHSAQIAVAVLIAAILTCIFRKRAAVCWSIWLVVLLKCVTPPLLEHSVSMFSWMDGPWMSRSVWLTEASGIAGIDLADKNETPLVPEDAISPLAETSENGEIFSVDSTRTVIRYGKTKPTSSTSTASPIASVSLFLGALSVFSLLWMSLRYLACRYRIHRNTVPDEGQRITIMLQSVATELAMKRCPRVRIVNVAVGPAVIGLFRPTIIIPKILVDQLDEATLRPVIAHELVHIKRGDLIVGAAQAFVQCVWWFHPFVWFANRMLTRISEQCCDQQVIERTQCTAAQYARSLVAVIECRTQLKPVPVFPGMKPVEITKKRLEKVMSFSQGSSRRSWPMAWLVMLAMIVVLLPGSAAQPPQQAGSAEEWQPLPKAMPLGTVLKAPVDAAAPPQKAQKTVSKTYDVSTLMAEAIGENGGESDHVALMIKEEITSAAKQAGPVSSLLKQESPDSFRLLLVATEEGHKAAAKVVDTRTKYGWAQVVLEATILTMDASETRLVFEESGLKLNTVLPRFKVANLESNGVTLSLGDTVESDQSIGEIALATITTETVTPVATAVTDESVSDTLLEKAKSLKTTTILSTPKLMTLNGASAMLTIGSERPFVIGVQDQQPQVQFVQEGISLDVLPELNTEGVLLSLNLKRSVVAETVQTEQTIPGSDEKIELPVVTEQKVSAAASIPKGQVLVVSGLPHESSDGTKKQIVLLLEPSKVQPAQSHDKEQEYVLIDPRTVEVYRVADLVVPIANGDPAAAPMEADFTGLIELIKTTVEPDSWSESDARIVPSKKTLSLVIRNRPNVHDDIKVLLNQIREHQDRQVATEVHSFSVPADLSSGLLPHLNRSASGESWAMLTPEQTESVITNLRKTSGVISTNPTQITTFDGKSFGVPLSGDTSPKFSVTTAFMGNGELLRMKIDAAAGQKQPANPISVIIGSGNSLLISSPDDAGSTILMLIPEAIRNSPVIDAEKVGASSLKLRLPAATAIPEVLERQDEPSR